VLDLHVFEGGGRHCRTNVGAACRGDICIQAGDVSTHFRFAKVSRRMHSDGVCAAPSFSRGDCVAMVKKIKTVHCCQGLMRHWQSAGQGTLAEIRMKYDDFCFRFPSL